MSEIKIYLHFENKTYFTGTLENPHIYQNNSSTELTKELLNSKIIIGESAFTTGMTGYQETITDPSYLGQHIIFTSAHIANYPSNSNQNQAEQTYATSIIAKNIEKNDFIDSLKIPVISKVDTRSLVRFLTKNTKISHKGIITLSKESPDHAYFQKNNLICNKLELVSRKSISTINAGENPIVVIDYGVKKAIINYLQELNYPLVIVPAQTSAKEIKNLNPRLIFLSNGPGDPRNYFDQISVIKELLNNKITIRGICLGHQLLALALGATVEKLPFGQRGINHPVFDHRNNRVRITSQNHGYSIKDIKLLDDFFIEYTSLFDHSIEGICSFDFNYRSVQFHPEAHPGPYDNLDFFTEIAIFLNQQHKKQELNLFPLPNYHQNKKTFKYKKILLIGSGPIRIGQASEFDYSGTQACKALRQLGIEVVLINSNPATIMTDQEVANKTYIEPICKESIQKIIIQEKVDGLISTMGGQTALNYSIELEASGFLKKHNVELLGASLETIEKTENRDYFARELKLLGYKTGKRFKANSKEDAIESALNLVMFPLIIRRDFALGGKGALLIHSIEEFKEILEKEIHYPITMEKSLLGWKELEMELMVDKNKNGVIICSIENIDPCGIHTGDSITVAPAQTISDRCLQNLRTMSLTIAKHMNIVAGGANVQFAINPENEDDIVVIEMNPRVSRSSALASKATGYPIAKISAQLAVGLTLPEILNDITNSTPVSFEPTLDYVAVKIPLFPFHKFPLSSSILGPQMRSIGEVLALGSNFNEAFLKALRSLEIGLEIPSLKQLKNTPFDLPQKYLIDRLSSKRQLSLVTVLDSLRKKISNDKIEILSKISPWFIKQMSNIVQLEKKTSLNTIHNLNFFKKLKKSGFSDKHIAFLSEQSQNSIYTIRDKFNIRPVFKAVDTCSAEFSATTPYFYSTYENENEAIHDKNFLETIIVLGSGPNRIGQGIEFDYSCVKAAKEIRSQKKRAVLINSNPETVSTDYDSSDRLYIASLYSEEIFDIIYNENPTGIITSFSGQSGIKIRSILENGFRSKYFNFPFLGSSLQTINLTEDRGQFSQILKQTSLSQTTSIEAKGYKSLINAILEIGFPVIIRPSFVIGGEAMYIFKTLKDLDQLPQRSKDSLKDPNMIFLVETYLENAIEYDVDLIRDKNNNCIFTVCEHIEHAGVHSGDSGMLTPPINLSKNLLEKMIFASKELASKLNILGPVNFQFAVKDDLIYCIEANPRGSRTLPFLSKALNRSLPSIATSAMLNQNIIESTKLPVIFAVKQSTFPFDRFLSDDIILGPKMRSTGETMSIDHDYHQAIFKSYLGNYSNLSKPGKILLSLADHSKNVIKPYIKQMEKIGYQIYATKMTANYIKTLGVKCVVLSRIGEEGLTILDILSDKNMRLVFNIPQGLNSSKADGEIIRNNSISFNVPCFTRRENIIAVTESIINFHSKQKSNFEVYSLQDHIC